MQRNAVWTLSNFCRGKPSPAWDRVSKILPQICRLLQQTKDYDIIVDILWALSFLSEDRSDVPPPQHVQQLARSRNMTEEETEQLYNSYQVDAVIETRVVPLIVQYVKHANQMGSQVNFKRKPSAFARLWFHFFLFSLLFRRL